MALLRQYFNGAHTFYVDPNLVDGARTCDISAIDLFFKHKPDVTLNLNDAPNPKVKIFIAETMYGVPRITRDSGIFTGQIAQVDIQDVLTSSDATAPTKLRFSRPVTIETDKEYAFVIIFDLLAQYVLWKSVQGELLTGTTNISPGPSNKLIGKYFESVSAFVAEDDTNLDEYLKNWRPVSDTTLKFNIYLARYAHSGVPVGANGSIDDDDIIRPNPSATVTSNSSGVNFNVNFGSYEYFTFNENISTKSAFVGGQKAFQNTVLYPGGYENGGTYLGITTNQGNSIITANTLLPNGSTFQWTNIFPALNPNYRIVLTNGSKYNVRSISSIISNTQVQLTEPVTFSNTAAKMMITPTGRVSSFNKDSPFGISESFVMLANSSANSTVRFVNNGIEAVSVTAGGSGYSNSDVFYVKGFENVAGKVTGGYVAVGNIVTNSTGGITTVYLSNLGCGFVNTSTIEAVLANSTNVGNTTSNTSAGSGSTFSYTVGATVKTEYGGNNFREVVVRNLDIGQFIPYSDIMIPPGTDYNLKLETNYIKKTDSNTYDGYAYYVNDDAGNTQLQITMYDINSLEPLSEVPVLPSKSNEFKILYENGDPNDKISNSSIQSSQVMRIVTDITSNSDFSTVRLERPSIQFSKYIINNDATNEHTDTGNAYAKGITSIIPFTRTAEDLRIYLTAYKPSNTDIKVYARIYKNEDPEAFDDKNWTELELKDGIDVLSSNTDPLDYVELTYGFRQVPEARTKLDGVVQVQTSNSTVLGSGTDFSTDLAAGDLVYMYQPLFPNNHLVVAVSSVTNSTAFVMDYETSNASITAEGMNIEKITYPMQAFNNKQNDNLVRYYNSSTSKFDGYESLAIKIVFLSDTPHKVPRIDDLKGTGTSA